MSCFALLYLYSCIYFIKEFRLGRYSAKEIGWFESEVSEIVLHTTWVDLPATRISWWYEKSTGQKLMQILVVIGSNEVVE